MRMRDGADARAELEAELAVKAAAGDVDLPALSARTAAARAIECTGMDGGADASVAIVDVCAQEQNCAHLSRRGICCSNSDARFDAAVRANCNRDEEADDEEDEDEEAEVRRRRELLAIFPTCQGCAPRAVEMQVAVAHFRAALLRRGRRSC